MTIVSYPPSLEKRTYCTPHIASPQPRHLCGPTGIAELRLPTSDSASAWQHLRRFVPFKSVIFLSCRLFFVPFSV